MYWNNLVGIQLLKKPNKFILVYERRNQEWTNLQLRTVTAKLLSARTTMGSRAVFSIPGSTQEPAAKYSLAANIKLCYQYLMFSISHRCGVWHNVALWFVDKYHQLITADSWEQNLVGSPQDCSFYITCQVQVKIVNLCALASMRQSN